MQHFWLNNVECHNRIQEIAKCVQISRVRKRNHQCVQDHTQTNDQFNHFTQKTKNYIVHDFSHGRCSKYIHLSSNFFSPNYNGIEAVIEIFESIPVPVMFVNCVRSSLRRSTSSKVIDSPIHNNLILILSSYTKKLIRTTSGIGLRES